MPITLLGNAMNEKLTVANVIGPLLFCAAVYFSWAFTRSYLCGIT
jgi:hypothetical protein